MNGILEDLKAGSIRILFIQALKQRDKHQIK